MLQKIFRYLATRLFSSAPVIEAHPVGPATSFADSPDFAAWVASVRIARRLPMSLADETIAILAERHPQQVRATIESAMAVLDHRFSLLGAIDFVPVDPDRHQFPNGYMPIDWRLDPISGLRFPAGFAHKSWNMQTMRPGNADIKLPWELARCQHFAVLGQAWLLTRDQRYARELLNQMRDFATANPVGIGVNWVCTMDVAIRAANWALALQMVGRCEDLEEGDWLFAYRQILEHGHFIRNNLEDKYEVTSNHFLSNVVGLLYVAAVCRDLPEGKEWLSWCVGMLEREIDVQILDDGADFESSIPYHRLVVELFLGGLVVAEHAERQFSEHYRDKLRSMIVYLLAMLRPDGLMPQIGDADDGRLHILSGYGRWKPQDARHLIAPAAHALGNPVWKTYTGAAGDWEAAWWGFAPTEIRGDNLPLADCAKLFPKAGHAVSRAGGEYLLVSNARVGTEGFGNHKHNDQLGFEYHVCGCPLIVDPGSYVYTSDAESRNLFRGTGYHNTLMIDGVEQNEINPEWLFRMFEKAQATHLDFSCDESSVTYLGRHEGYCRLDQPLVHERLFRHEPSSRELLIADRISGSGRHSLKWHFHFAPGVAVSCDDDPRAVALNLAQASFVMILPSGFRPMISPAWYSPSYGVRQACMALDIVAGVDVDGEYRCGFAIVPQNANRSGAIKKLDSFVARMP